MGWLMLMLCAKVVGFVGARGVKADVDVVVLAAVRVIHLDGELGFRSVVAARENLMVEPKVCRFSGCGRHQAEGRWRAWSRSTVICGHSACTAAPNSLKMCQLVSCARNS